MRMALLLLLLMAGVSRRTLCQETEHAALDAWKVSCDKVTSYDVQLTALHSYAADGEAPLLPVQEFTTRQRGEGKDWRVDFLRVRHFEKGVETKIEDLAEEGILRAFSSNGMEFRSLDSKTNFAMLGSASHANEARTGSPLFPAFFKENLFGQTYLSEVLAREYSISTAEDGTAFILAPKSSRFSSFWRSSDLEFDLSSAHGFLPKRFSVASTSKKGVKSNLQYSIEHKKSEQGFWIPAEIRRAVYEELPDGSKRRRSTVEIKIDMKHATFNIALPKELYELRPFPGTTVFDEFAMQNYIVGPNGEKDYEAFRRKTSKLLNKANPPTPSPKPTKM